MPGSAVRHLLRLLVCNAVQLSRRSMTVTKHLSASHRVVLNALRPGLVWAFSLAFRWQPFSWLQLGGFVVLTIGTLMYYEVRCVRGGIVRRVPPTT